MKMAEILGFPKGTSHKVMEAGILCLHPARIDILEGLLSLPEEDSS